MTGPTTTGSIDAKLTIDDSQFMAKLAAAEAAARKLGSVDPNISIDVDDRGAISKLAAVDAAASRLDGSTKRLAVSQKALNDTNGGGIQRWQLIAAAIAALIPLLGPLAGYAVGVAGALAGMGAAGALAIYGIVKAMKDGTVTGAEYKSGLGQLKSALDSLGNTAATAMLGSFKQVVGQINAALPMLNGQIRTFSQILGVAGNAVLAGVVNALRILNPLFVQASKYVLDLANGFKAWTADGGLQKFANYAMTQLPIVANTLGQLAAAGLHIVEALAPLGTVVLQALGALGGAISAIPLPILMDVATAAGAAFAAFKLWGLIQPILSTVASSIGAVGIATQLATGPIGWVTAGISALAAVLAINVTASQQATQAAAEYAAALKQDNDAIGANVRAVAAKQLQDSGALDAAQKLGISAREVTDATLGDMTARQRAGTTMQAWRDKIMETSKETNHLTGQQQAQLAAIEMLGGVMAGNNQQVNEAIAKSKQLAAATAGANDKTASSTGLMGALKDATNGVADATDKLSQKLRGLGQVNLDASTANLSYQQSLADATAALGANGATLDANTQKGRDNQRALDGIASSGIGLVAAQAATGASTAQLTGTMAAARQGFVDTAIKMGATATQANALADQYGLIPKNVTTAVQVTGADAAKNKVQDLQNWINGLHGKTVIVDAIVNRPAGAPGQGLVATGRTGGTIGGLAGGGGGSITGAGNAYTDTAGLFRLANGEEVVSNMHGQASMWRSALKLMNSGADPRMVASAVNKRAGVTAQAAPPQSRNEPIYADGVGLIGWIRQVAGSQAQLVWNAGMSGFAQQMDGGLV